ncbi:SET domain-containing protein [Daedaleopsis nitida]|nr:SET domain-containing protein [Daedaleopsis nitida]
MVDDEHPARAFVGRRKRGEDASEASSSSGPRRSARLSSSSASSSVEPPDDIEEPRRRLRRREPYIHNPSEEDVAAYGGISRSRYNKYLQAFESAGFGSLSWRKDKRRIAKEHAPVTQLAENIPHDLHDRLNALNSSARRAGNMQVLIFEAEMLANTAEDEPDAPPIRIVNEVDDEPTPPLEFYYSNLMWHGKGVPKPDYDALQGCGCVGPCDPMSKTCSCLKRQKRFLEQENNSQVGFIYDKKGRLKANEYPIFECNMNCGCSDDCMNRVIQHGRQHEIMIQKTVNKGWGVFAGPKKIPANTYIGIYAGEYLLDAEGEHRGKMYNKFGRTYLFDIDFYYLRKEDDQIKYTIDAYHAGNNHSCDPNCTIVAAYINEANLDKPLLSIFTKRDVEPYEEICFSYFGDGDDNDLPQDGSDDDASPVYDGAVYVKCQCGAENCRGNMWK